MHTSGVLEISLSAITANYALCQQAVGADCIVAPAVKADAYGTGLEKVAPALWDAGARQFFVATLEEGMRLRGLLQNARIAVLNGVLPNTMVEFARNNLIPVINGPDQARIANDFARRDGVRLKSILHVDTGMNRLGFTEAEWQGFISAHDNYDALEIDTIMSHFASADELDNDFTEIQNAAFGKLTEALPFPARRSLANSSAIFRGSQFHYDMVRPGMCLYGLNPSPDLKNPMQSTARLSVPVLQVHAINAGEACGYGQSYKFDKASKLATVSLGYADGFLRSLSNRGALYWNGQACPIRGRVSMDTVIVEIGHLPEGAQPALGDRLEVLGDHQSADDLADAAGTIGYEVMTSLGARYAREYIG